MDVLQLITLICQRKNGSYPTSFSAARIFLVIYSGECGIFLLETSSTVANG